MEAKPFAGVAMPRKIKAVGAYPVETGEGRIELLAEMVRETSGSTPIPGTMPDPRRQTPWVA